MELEKILTEEEKQIRDDERNWDIYGIPKINIPFEEKLDNAIHIRPLDESDMS